MFRIFFILTSILVVQSCKTKVGHVATDKKSSIEPSFVSGPQTIVYKTVEDYLNFVPIGMDESRKEVTSYPAPSDVKINSGFRLPTILSDSFLLDNLGIHKNSVFTNYTYADYAMLKSTPKLSEFHDRILSKNPFIIIYNCGNRNMMPNLESTLNSWILSGQLETKCKQIFPQK